MTQTTTQPRMTGIARVLVAVYAVMALGSTGRSVVQIIRDFADAPLSYSLSAAAAVVYILATVALILSNRRSWYIVAWFAVIFELAGVVSIGTLSITMPEIFQHATVWSLYGDGYVFIPLVLPLFGLWYLIRTRNGRFDEPEAQEQTEGAVW